jgi:hypothetical protein
MKWLIQMSHGKREIGVMVGRNEKAAGRYPVGS